MVPTNTTTHMRSVLYTPINGESFVNTQQTAKTSVKIHEDGSFQNIRRHLQGHAIPEKAANVIIASWRNSTKKQHGSYLKKWLYFCSERQISNTNPSVSEIVKFLTYLFDSGLGYSAINTARSALSAYFDIVSDKNLTSNVLVKRFVKGIYQLKPSLPKYNCTWDVKLVLDFLKTLKESDILLKFLTVKLVTLLALVTGQRCQTISLLNLNDLDIQANNVKIRIKQLLKQSKSGTHLPEIYIERYANDENLCVINTLKQYIEKTKTIRKSDELLLTTQKPHNPASKSTIAGWIKLALKLSGVDMNIYSAHSTRSASTSAVATRVPIDSVMKTAGWKKECTFRKFYNKTINNDSSFSHNVLALNSDNKETECQDD